MGRVEFYYDLVSPYSYLAYGRVARLCGDLGAGLELRPVLLGAVHKAVGIRAPIEVEAKARYHMEDIRRWAGHYGLPMKFPRPFPFRTLKTMRAAVYVRELGLLEDFTREAFALYWEEGGAPGGRSERDEDGPVAEVARRAGADPGEVLTGASAPRAKAALREATEEAVGRGVFGAPTFFVDGAMFWGNDRLRFVEAALGGQGFGGAAGR